MNITATQVKELREKTGCGMMDCKRALVEADGDVEKAIDILRKKGLDASVKKASRATVEGVAMAVVNDDQSVGALIEVNSETDFVARNTQFLNFVKTCAKSIIDNDVSNVDELLKIKGFNSDLTIGDLLKEKILVIGENIRIKRFIRKRGVISGYIHSGGKIATLVEFEASDDTKEREEFKTMSKDIAMHVAAAFPRFLDESEISESVKDHERQILKEQMASEKKPEAILERIIQGRMNKFYKESCLLNQEFVKNPDFTISSYIKKISKDLGSEIKIKSFARYEKGEDV